MWTVPNSVEQKAYFSKHAEKRRVFGWAQTLFQTGHFFLAYSFWVAIFTSALAGIINPPGWWGIGSLALGLLGGGVLMILHSTFRVTWSTYWYDRLDDDPNTDSSIFLPILILVLLLLSEQQGAKVFLQNKVAPVAEQSTAEADAALDAKSTALAADYEKGKADLATFYAERERDATAKTDRSIAEWSRKTVYSDNDRAFVNRNLASLSSQRMKIMDGVRAEREKDFTALRNEKTAAKQRAEGRHEAATSLILKKNAGEVARFETDMAQTGSHSWLISTVLLALIAALGYVRVRINVKSGILPVRNFTAIDQHGGWSEQIGTVLGDAWKRNVMVAATKMHKKLSPAEVHTIDGTLIAKASDYNSQRLPDSAPSIQPPLELDALLEKVRKKHGENLTGVQLAGELRLAATHNGSYLTIGKKSERGAADQPSATDAHPFYVELLARAAAKTDDIEVAAPTPPLFIAGLPEFCVTASQPVTQVEPDLAAMGGDEFIEFMTVKMKRDIPNLLNGNGIAATVIQRLKQVLEITASRVGHPGFSARRTTIVKLQNYLEGAFAAATKSATALLIPRHNLYDALGSVIESVELETA